MADGQLRMQPTHGESPRDLIRRIIGVYESLVIRAYCRVRFVIMRQRFLDEIGQYLPERGHVLDVGCGFGLFALYYASRNPALRIHGLDLNERRVAYAKRAAAALGLTNVEFSVGDAALFQCVEGLDGAYMLDIVHHLARPDAVRLLAEVSAKLVDRGRLLIKDVSDRPWWKMAFTLILDKAMTIRAPVDYWSPTELTDQLRKFGLTVYRHEMVDLLPYPHVLYVSIKAPSRRPSL
jgi:2-polyprenyl-3-methyl-5-hydroxy-6-metoxy-1,4-benzoquinol methylase